MQVLNANNSLDSRRQKYLLMTDTPHNLLQKTTPVYTDPANSQRERSYFTNKTTSYGGFALQIITIALIQDGESQGNSWLGIQYS